MEERLRELRGSSFSLTAYSHAFSKVPSPTPSSAANRFPSGAPASPHAGVRAARCAWTPATLIAASSAFPFAFVVIRLSESDRATRSMRPSKILAPLPCRSDPHRHRAPARRDAGELACTGTSTPALPPATFPADLHAVEPVRLPPRMPATRSTRTSVCREPGLPAPVHSGTPATPQLRLHANPHTGTRASPPARLPAGPPPGFPAKRGRDKPRKPKTFEGLSILLLASLQRK